MRQVNPLLLTDFYKVGHVFQYPPSTKYVYSNFTPRSTRVPHLDHMVWFGLQYFCIRYLMEYFSEGFFNRPKDEVMREYKRRIKTALGGDLKTYDHVAALHDLGYLPVRIKALLEGTLVPMRVPCMTIVNTHPDFYWVTNFLETLISCVLWQPCTSATIARHYRMLFDYYGGLTGMPKEFVQWQGHDFSFRGMSSPDSAIASGMGHLLSFSGTDTIPAIDALEMYYGADAEKELIGGSVPATEHSVMCAGGEGSEEITFRRLITEVYPTGIVSVVSDTWDLWRVLTVYMPLLKDVIMARDGKLVIRPDSGDPVKIICGDPFGTEAVRKGVVQLLWDVFGGTVSPTGHKILDSHVGVIYGDSITPQRAAMICQQLNAKGFASQVVFGIGSYTYQNNTRDTFGTAIKATWAHVGGDGWPIWKDPKTDDGIKRSAKGLLRVDRNFGGKLVLTDNVTQNEEQGGLLQTVFVNGKLMRRQTLQEIRRQLTDQHT